MSKISDAEVLDLIKRRIPADMRADYLRMCAGVSISKNRKLEIESIIRGIVEA